MRAQKPSFALNGWQRIGIVLSIAWILGGGLWAHTADFNRAQEASDATSKLCVDILVEREEREGKYYDVTPCTDEAMKILTAYTTGIWGDTAIVAFAPIPIAWLVAYAGIWIVEWVRRGFYGGPA